MHKILFIILLFAFGCTQTAKDKTIISEKEFPFDFVEQISSQMGNSLIDNPNKIIVRIWEVSSLIQPKLLYTFTQDGPNYSSQLCLFYQDSIAFTNQRVDDTIEIKKSYYLLDSLTCYRFQPELSVKNIIDTTFALGIDKLKSQPKEVKARVGDGETYIVEIRKGKDYRVIEYNNPDYFFDEDHKRFSEYLDLVLDRK